ncbi:hypothetical protein L7F22_045140 [Adiantum nelumboides]|nr:hypothetical protein [Adiantum nelumboides]
MYPHGIIAPIMKCLSVPFQWSEPEAEAFAYLKKRLTEVPILVAPDWSLPSHVHTDASQLVVDAVLTQPSKEYNLDRPVHYASRLLTEAERNYSTTEREVVLRPGKHHVMADHLSRVQTGEATTGVEDDFPDSNLFKITNKVYPISSYAILVFILLAAPACEYVSYKALIIAGSFSQLLGYLVMRFGTTILSLQIMQIMQAWSDASYFVYQAFLFFLVAENHFQTMTSFSQASTSMALFVSTELGSPPVTCRLVGLHTPINIRLNIVDISTNIPHAHNGSNFNPDWRTLQCPLIYHHSIDKDCAQQTLLEMENFGCKG